MTARPRPPLGAHSSLATRSSLFARIARHTVVTLTPCPFVSVYEHESLYAGGNDVDLGKGGHTWKRYTTPQELKSWL